jgi:two-component system sensor histidine kinase DegS
MIRRSVLAGDQEGGCAVPVPAADKSPSPSPGGRTIDALEEEQRRLARTIHDGPAQVLTNLALHSEIIERLIGVDNARAVHEVREMRHDALAAAEEMRQMIYQLVPPGLLQHDLAGVLQEHASRLQQRYGISVQLDVSPDVDLDKGDQVTIFRVVQEALQNALRHSQSATTWVRLSREGRDIVAEVWDRGTGFDPNDPALHDGRHLGIAGMRERAQLAGGALSVESQADAGTRVTLRLPR